MKTRICVSTYGKTTEELVDNVNKTVSRYGNVLVEVRVDYLEEEVNADVLVEKLRPYADRLVITVRPADQGGYYRGEEEERLLLLRRLALMQPAYVDVELDRVDDKLVKNFRGIGVKTIVSWHDFRGTPSRSDLIEVTKQSINLGDVAKIVTMSRGVEDNLNILYLYSLFNPTNLIAFCMGEQGRVTRVLSAAAGAPIVYASTKGRETAPGQYSVDELLEILEWPSHSVGVLMYGEEK